MRSPPGGIPPPHRAAGEPLARLLLAARSFLRSDILATPLWPLYRPSTGAVMLLAAIHTCDEVGSPCTAPPRWCPATRGWAQGTWHKAQRRARSCSLPRICRGRFAPVHPPHHDLCSCPPPRSNRGVLSPAPGTGAGQQRAQRRVPQVSAFGFMTPGYRAYSDHYFDRRHKEVQFFVNHDLKLEMQLWQRLQRSGLLRLYTGTEGT